jgi:hypothetical protein
VEEIQCFSPLKSAFLSQPTSQQVGHCLKLVLAEVKCRVKISTVEGSVLPSELDVSTSDPRTVSKWSGSMCMRLCNAYAGYILTI